MTRIGVNHLISHASIVESVCIDIRPQLNYF